MTPAEIGESGRSEIAYPNSESFCVEPTVTNTRSLAHIGNVSPHAQIPQRRSPGPAKTKILLGQAIKKLCVGHNSCSRRTPECPVTSTGSGIVTRLVVGLTRQRPKRGKGRRLRLASIDNFNKYLHLACLCVLGEGGGGGVTYRKEEG